MVTDPETAREIAKATKATAETTGKAIDAGRDVGGFIAKYIGGSLEQGMGIFEDKLKYMRWERQVRLMRRVAEVAAANDLGEPTRPLPLKFAVPFFQGASLEDDDSLQDRWVNLLLNVAYEESGVDAQRAYIHTLEQLNALEAALLDKIYAFPFHGPGGGGVVTANLPHSAIQDTGSPSASFLPSEDVCVALQHLYRLGCLAFQYTADGGQFLPVAYPTLFGKRFMSACRAPAP